MSLAILKSRALSGMDAPEVTVEVHLANGLPSFTIVGLPETEVKETRNRVRAALQNIRFEFPARRITVNLAPTDLQKESDHFDLPIALGILAASGQISQNQLDRHEFAGKLSLSGELRPIRGALAMAFAISRNEKEAQRSFILPAATLLEVCSHLNAVSGMPVLVPHIPRHNRSVPKYPDSIARYQRKISGPLLDRIDIQVQVGALRQEELSRYAETGESSETIARRVKQARDIQQNRQCKPNNLLTTVETDDFCRLDESGERLLKDAMARLMWSARAYHRILKIARTIADLAQATTIRPEYVAEAIQYRRALKEI